MSLLKTRAEVELEKFQQDELRQQEERRKTLEKREAEIQKELRGWKSIKLTPRQKSEMLSLAFYENNINIDALTKHLGTKLTAKHFEAYLSVGFIHRNKGEDTYFLTQEGAEHIKRIIAQSFDPNADLLEENQELWKKQEKLSDENDKLKEQIKKLTVGGDGDLFLVRGYGPRQLYVRAQDYGQAEQRALSADPSGYAEKIDIAGIDLIAGKDNLILD